MIRKLLLSLLILFAATSAVHAAEPAESTEPTFSERKTNLTEVSAIRVGYGSGTVRIVVDMSRKVEFTESYAENPSRVIIDLKDTWLNPTARREITLNSLAAKKIRVAQFDPTTVRIVIESMADIRPFNMSGGPKGHRFIIDVGNAKFTPAPDTPTTTVETPAPVTPTTTVETPAPDTPTPATENSSAELEREAKERQEREAKERQEREAKEQHERELKERLEREAKERQEREAKEQREREAKERQEREAKEQREREKALEKERKAKLEREIKEQREREKALEKERKEREKQERREKKDRDKKAKDKDDDGSEVDQPFKELDTDLSKLTALSGKKIVIDPGHGGNDAGAIGPTGVMEKNVTLKVALEAKRLLETEGATVIMTRETDRTVSAKGAAASDIEELGARCEVANLVKADIFISIHADSFTRPEARGTTGYYYGKSTTGNGQRLADAIRRNLVEQLGTPSRGTQPCNFYVVKHTDMPATLIELGFISNKDEEKLLDSAEGVRKAAQAILDGIEDYFG